jgi:hypothetical protein
LRLAVPFHIIFLKNWVYYCQNLQLFMAFYLKATESQNRLIEVPPPNKTKLAMESSSSNASNVPLPASQRPLHATDADEEDDSVKQLNECATVYLSLQVLSLLSSLQGLSKHKSLVSFNTNLRPLRFGSHHYCL